MKIIRPVQVTQAGSFTRNSPATYFDVNGVMQVAVANAVRVTYDPGNLSKAPYALLEQPATNLVTYSEQFENAAWANVGTTVGTNAVIAPTGTVVGDKLVETAANSQHYTYYQRAGTNETTTFSVYLKAAERSLAQVAMNDSALSIAFCYFDLTTGVVTSPSTTLYAYSGVSAKMQAVGNGWYRCSITATKAGGSPLNSPVVSLGVYNSQGHPTISYTGDGTSGFYMFGAQLEAGTVASSYIATASTTASRAADTIASSGLLYSNVPETDYPSWSTTTAYVKGDRVLDVINHKVYESISGLKNAVTIPASSTTMSMLDTTNALIIPAAGTPVKLSSTGTLPSGFNATATYYVVAPTATGFSLSATAGGTAISSGTAGTGTYTLVTQVNLNKPINDILNWVYVGLDNRWTMFDQSITSQSTNPGNAIIAFSPGQRMDSVVGLNCTGSAATVSMVDINTGNVVYSANVKLSSNSGITDWYAYFFEPIVQISDFVLDDLPIGISSSCIITVAVLSAQTAKVGGLVFGLSKEIGLTEWGTKVSVVDYSVKTQDAFGNYTITPRAFSKKADFTVQVPTDTVDFLHSIMSQYRSTPVVYIGYNSGGRTKFSSTVIYGYYKDFSIDIAYNAFSVCSLTVEGLT